MKKTSLIAIILALACVMSLSLASCDFAQGAQGEQGIQGEAGEKGDKGDQGEDGKDGEDGRGILKVEIVDGELIITYTDGTVTNAGVISSNNGSLSSNEGTYGLEYYPLPDGTYAVSAGTTKYLEEIVIPKEYNGKAVSTILPNAFDSNSNLKNITIPDSVTSIGDAAFSGCTSLASIEIPDSVTSIGNYAFRDCSSLTSVEIGDSVTSIGSYAFSGCTSLEAVYISDIVAWCNISFDSSDGNPLCYVVHIQRMSQTPPQRYNFGIRSKTHCRAGSTVAQDVHTGIFIFVFPGNSFGYAVKFIAIGFIPRHTFKFNRCFGNIAVNNVKVTDTRHHKVLVECGYIDLRSIFRHIISSNKNISKKQVR